MDSIEFRNFLTILEGLDAKVQWRGDEEPPELPWLAPVVREQSRCCHSLWGDGALTL